MTITDADRPDPVCDKQANARYAEVWAASHRNITDEMAYRANYADVLVLDRLLADYTLLDVGCGTGGYLRLCKNHAAITAFDFSSTMIEQAHKLQEELGLERVTFLCEKFETYQTDQQFDIVRMGGAVGAYRPWPGNEYAFQKTRDLVRVGGIAIASHIGPASLIDIAKTTLFPRRTVVIEQSKLLALAAGYGFEYLFSVEFKESTRVFLRRTR
ncbi:MAG: methyltransferase domain-containing protein [Acidobacteriia bacterium]|nr:methyltransferase domain-containing protein [Terriglobia bacterium]